MSAMSAPAPFAVFPAFPTFPALSFTVVAAGASVTEVSHRVLTIAAVALEVHFLTGRLDDLGARSAAWVGGIVGNGHRRYADRRSCFRIGRGCGRYRHALTVLGGCRIDVRL